MLMFQGTQVDFAVSGYVCCFSVHIRWLVLFQGMCVVSGYTSGGLCCFRVHMLMFQGTHQVDCAVSGYVCYFGVHIR